MILFPNGIKLTKNEHLCLMYVVPDIDAWVNAVLQENVAFSRDKLCKQWERKLFLDPAVKNIPADMDGQAAFIMARPDYKTRLQREAEAPDPQEPTRDSILIYEAKNREAEGSVTICSNGIEISDFAVACLMSRIEDINNFILGAILGTIYKGRSLMKRHYLDVLRADSSVTSFPADDDELVAVITARPDYRTLPEQLRDIGEQRKQTTD